jgi:uncharacterized membrane protein
MMDGYAMLLGLRVAHVVGGAMWVGAAVMLAGFVVPAAQGPDAGGFMQRLMVGRRAQWYLMGTAVVTILSGVALFARMEALTDGGFSGTDQGMAFGVGGLAGVAALLTGALVNGPAARRMAALGARLRADARPPSAEEAGLMARLRTRTRWASRIAMLLLVTAVACMAIGRYV